MTCKVTSPDNIGFILCCADVEKGMFFVLLTQRFRRCDEGLREPVRGRDRGHHDTTPCARLKGSGVSRRGAGHHTLSHVSLWSDQDYIQLQGQNSIKY